MPAPDAPTCQYRPTRAILAHLGTVKRIRFRLLGRQVKPCPKQATHRVKTHVISAGLGVWVVAETCCAHRDELTRLPHAWSRPIAT